MFPHGLSDIVLFDHAKDKHKFFKTFVCILEILLK